MLRIFGDAESYYDREYSLRKMSPIEYILDKRWETLGWAVAIEHEPAMILPRNEIVAFLRDIKQPYCFISHNALFDACILAFRHNIHPARLFCTLNMSRAVLLHEIRSGRVSLASVLKHLGFTPKSDFIEDMAGKHWKDLQMNPGLMMGWTGYTINDLEGCRDIFFKLRTRFPPAETMIMDRVIRMATQPVLLADRAALEIYAQKLLVQRIELLARVNVDRSALMSNPKLAESLRSMGVEPPIKVSPATGKETYAFAKNDQAFVDLLEHDNPDVQTLVAVRLGLKSTIEETRTARLLNIAKATANAMKAPRLPCPLKYCGAHTGRLSGDWRLNLQNLSARKSREIRTAIVAPPGYTIVAVDAAQIEARITAWLAKQTDLLEQFANHEDVYRLFAAKIFDCTPDAITKIQRFVGKTCILGLGFGLSGDKLYYTIITQAREQNLDLGDITKDKCREWVDIYRTAMARITRCWGTLNFILRMMAEGRADGMKVGPFVIDGTTVISPGGLRLYYDDLFMDDQKQYWYKYGASTKKIYGAKLLENCVQHLDRQHVTEAGMRTEARARALGVPDPRVLLNVHDENVHCIPDEYVDVMAGVALEEMRRNVGWSEGLPLNAEVKLGRNFGELEEWKP